MTTFRKDLSAPGLISIVRKQFSKVPDPREFTKNVTVSITDHLMSGLAVFGLKCPSLLDFGRKRPDSVIAQNLRDLYHINNALSDTYLRERLDNVDPDHIRPAFKKIFALFQRGKGFKPKDKRKRVAAQFCKKAVKARESSNNVVEQPFSYRENGLFCRLRDKSNSSFRNPSASLMV